MWFENLRLFEFSHTSDFTRSEFCYFDEYLFRQLLPYVYVIAVLVCAVPVLCCFCKYVFRNERQQDIFNGRTEGVYSYSTNQTYYNFSGGFVEQRNQSVRYISVREHQQKLLDEQVKQNRLKDEIQREIRDKYTTVKYLKGYYQRKLLEEQDYQKSMEKDYQQRLLREKMQQKSIKEHWEKKFQEEQIQKQLLEIMVKVYTLIAAFQLQQEKINEQIDSLTLLFNLPVIHRRLSQATFKNILATNWDSKLHNKTFLKVKVPEDTDEFANAKCYFKCTSQKGFEVVKIERIENPYILGCYVLKKLEMEEAFGASNVREIDLFHGTKAKNVDNICENNFNWRQHGESFGNKYGKGVSFTPFSNYANHYSDKCAARVMFLVKVLISKCTIGNQHMEIPPLTGSAVANKLRFDTTVKEDISVLVKYSDNEFYPQYLIHYSAPKTKQRKRNRKHKIKITKPIISSNS